MDDKVRPETAPCHFRHLPPNVVVANPVLGAAENLVYDGKNFEDVNA
jgi:hypothetical protein